MSLLSLVPVLGKVLDRVLPDEKAKAEAKIEMINMLQQGELESIKVQGEIVKAEAQGESWLQRNWRPVTMLVFVFIVFNNYILVPYFQLFGLPATYLELPQDMWNLLTVGIGGYVVGRSGEKAVKLWKEK